MTIDPLTLAIGAGTLFLVGAVAGMIVLAGLYEIRLARAARRWERAADV